MLTKADQLLATISKRRKKVKPRVMTSMTMTRKS